jgi:hypothetical protein
MSHSKVLASMRTRYIEVMFAATKRLLGRAGQEACVPMVHLGDGRAKPGHELRRSNACRNPCPRECTPPFASGSARLAWNPFGQSHA